MSDDLSILLGRIHVLLDRRHTADASDLEHTLTDGYARALALEGEQRRTSERIRELAGDAAHEGELRSLKTRLSSVEEELAELRSLLGVLAASL